jgi:predicted small secreted protein
MKKLRLNFLLLMLSLLIGACNTTGGAKPSVEFGGITLSKGIDKQGVTGVPRDVGTTFVTDDPEVIAYVKFTNISGMHSLKWEWYAPNNVLYYETDEFPIDTAEGKYRKELAAWHRLSISGNKAINYLGDWEVKTYMDNKPLAAKKFVLAAPELERIPGTAQKPFPKDWALVIGIEEYSGLPPVSFAKRDALVVKDYFNKVLGVPEENIITLIDKDATKGRIEGFIKQYLPDNVSKDTTLYVYFAGHGAPDMAKGEPYLVPYDGDTRFIEQTGYNLKDFYLDLNKIKLQRVYIFLDSCFSGVASRATDMLVKGARPALIHVERASIQTTSMVAITAANEAQVSNAYTDQKHGLFTYYLLKGLGGEADADNDHWVSVKELFQYIKNNVNRVSRRIGTEQTPTIMPAIDMIKDLAISRSMK